MVKIDPIHLDDNQNLNTNIFGNVIFKNNKKDGFTLYFNN